MPSNLDQPTSVKSVLAEFSAKRRKRVFVCLGLCVAALVAGFSISSTAVALSIMVAMVILLVMFIGVDRSLSGELNEKLIPVLAQEVGGLDYTRAGPDMEPILGKRLLPVCDVARCEDLFHGDLGTHSLSFWEATLTRGMARSKTVVFRGQLIDVTVDDTRYLLLRPRRGVIEEAWFAQKDPIRPADADRYGIRVGSETFDVWKQEGAWDHPALEAYLTELLSVLPPYMHFAGLLQAKGQVLIALGTNQDLFRFGGLMTSKLNAQLEIDRAFKDLAIAPAVAAHWIGAANLPREVLKG